MNQKQLFSVVPPTPHRDCKKGLEYLYTVKGPWGFRSSYNNYDLNSICIAKRPDSVLVKWISFESQQY